MTSLEGVPPRACNGSDLGAALSVLIANTPLMTPANDANGTVILDTKAGCVAQ